MMGIKFLHMSFEQEQITTPIEGISFNTLLKENNIE
jgi:hypothetical protein